ncbi:MAG: tetratricopeptide repeat protein, partial [Stackebrandtia sp.]
MTPKDSPEAIKAAAETGDLDAMFHYGLLRHDDGADAEAVSWWRRAADAGSHKAMHNLGIVYQLADQPEEGERWFRRLAATGDADAMGRVALSRMDDDDLSGAVEWWQQAADAGDVDSIYNLAVYRKGRDEPAESLFRAAAEAGHPLAMRQLGLLAAERGEMTAARLWLERAALDGDTDALPLLDQHAAAFQAEPDESRTLRPGSSVALGLAAEDLGDRIAHPPQVLGHGELDDRRLGAR